VFENLYEKIKHPAIFEMLKVLHEKGVILFIINYDDFLEKYYNLYRIGRSNQDDILKFKNSFLDEIFYIHGNYHEPYEVVLDTTDYYAVIQLDKI
jgi:hypothetical protein